MKVASLGSSNLTRPRIKGVRKTWKETEIGVQFEPPLPYAPEEKTTKPRVQVTKPYKMFTSDSDEQSTSTVLRGDTEDDVDAERMVRFGTGKKPDEKTNDEGSGEDNRIHV